MPLVETYYQADEPPQTAPGTVWLRADGTKAQRGLSGQWIEKGSWTEENDGMMSVNGGTVLGPVLGNHGHAPLDSPAFLGTMTLNGEEVPDKPWVNDQIQAAVEAIQSFVNGVMTGGETISIGNDMAIGYGVVADGGTIPLPKYADGTRAILSEVWGVLPSLRYTYFHFSAGTNLLGVNIRADANLLVTAKCEYGVANWVSVEANYIIICKR